MSFFWNSSNALDVMALPPLDNFVVDYTQTLTSGQIETLSSQAYQIQQDTSNQIAALIIPDRGGYELYDIALDVFRTTGLGDKTVNNGLLLIIAKDEKKLRLTVGYGLEWTIPDVEAKQIIEKIRPFVDNGDIYGAVELYYKLITPYFDGTVKAIEQNTDIYNFSLRDQIWGIVLFLAISSAFWSSRIFWKIKSEKTKPKKSILAIGTLWLIILALVSLFLVSFWFLWGLVGYIIWLITGTSWWMNMMNNRNRWWYRWWGFWGFRWSSGRFGWGGFSGGFGWSSWGGGAWD